MWNCTPSEGVRLPSQTLTEPGQVCLTIRQILERFGALPDIKEVNTGLFESEEQAEAALDVAYMSKEEALEKAAELAEQLATRAESAASKRPESEEGPIPSPPQDSEEEEPAPPVVPASSDKAKT